eukprot:TRINITY_DN104676_c0_g1_i1.p1 TRINITY_DN104676_c0_g1~~TRINITY_DN104676_c0_g1_i1.p1  ORF type:complete len:400 (+),score=97.54 TRINITY_DN104676_c0_g1_i1:62-1201(+)
MAKGKNGCNKIAAASPAAAAAVAVQEPSEEELEEERRRQAKRDEKARAEEQKAANDIWWREQKAREQAKQQRQTQKQQKKQDQEWEKILERGTQEGILKSYDGGDGHWYVSLGKNVYKAVQTEFFCIHCSSELNWCSLESHLQGARHQKCMANGTSAAASSAPSSCSTATPSSSVASLAPQGNLKLEDWQELNPDGTVQCTLCNRRCDGVHEYTDAHDSRLKWHQSRQQNAGYPAPAQPWLAWVPTDWGECELKCLLCNKGVSDVEGKLTDSYMGLHGAASAHNQKDHSRKMQNLSDYLADMKAVKDTYHPPQVPMPTPWPAEVAVHVGLWQPPQVPEGWEAIWSEEHEDWYYHSECEGVTQWEMPTADASRPTDVDEC